MFYDTNRRHLLAMQDRHYSREDLWGEPEGDGTLSEAQAAGYLGLTKEKLAGRRKRGTGPTVVDTRWGPRYRMEDLNRWIEETPPSKYKPGTIKLVSRW